MQPHKAKQAESNNLTMHTNHRITLLNAEPGRERSTHRKSKPVGGVAPASKATGFPAVNLLRTHVSAELPANAKASKRDSGLGLKSSTVSKQQLA